MWYVLMWWFMGSCSLLLLYICTCSHQQLLLNVENTILSLLKLFWNIFQTLYLREMCATRLVQVLYLERHVLQFISQSHMCVPMYAYTVQSSRYNSQTTELIWCRSHSPPALCRFRLLAQPTNTFQLQLTHTTGATVNSLCAYTQTFMAPLQKVYPHASESSSCK